MEFGSPGTRTCEDHKKNCGGNFLIPGRFTEWGNDLGTLGVGGRMQSLRKCGDHKKNCGGKFLIPGSFTEWGNDLGTRGVGGRI